MADKLQSELINVPNLVQAKVTVGGPGAVTPEVLAQAEAIVSNMTDDYLEWVKGDLGALRRAFENLKSGGGNGREQLDAMFRIVHDMRGQGGSFGYKLITVIGNQLCHLLGGLEEAGPAEIEAIGVYIEAMNMVIARDMYGDGGPEAEQMLKGLEKVGAKFVV